MKQYKLLTLLLGACLLGGLTAGCKGSQTSTSRESSFAQTGSSQPVSTLSVLPQPTPRTVTINDPNTSLKGITNLKAIDMLTGEDSINKTSSNYDIAGTDLGIFIQHKGKMYIAFGDTFSGDGNGNNMVNGWRSNTMAYTTDFDASNGIKFDGMISIPKVGDKKAIELLSSEKTDNKEMTVIPTGGFSLGNDMYLAFMSVKHWGEPGSWDVNYAGLAKSTDDGQSWVKLDNLKWTDNNFGQLCPLVVGDYVYFYAIPGGRNGGLKIMRVKTGQVENQSKYEYLTAMDGSSNPVFKTGNPSIAMQAVPPAVGEPCVVYNKYLNEYLLSYFSNNSIGLRASKNPWGPWSNYLSFVSSADYPQLYGGFMSPVYTGNGGKTVYFTMSLYGDYNVALMSIDLMK